MSNDAYREQVPLPGEVPTGERDQLRIVCNEATRCLQAALAGDSDAIGLLPDLSDKAAVLSAPLNVPPPLRVNYMSATSPLSGSVSFFSPGGDGRGFNFGPYQPDPMEAWEYGLSILKRWVRCLDDRPVARPIRESKQNGSQLIRDDQPTSAEIEQGRMVLANMSVKHPSLRAFREAARKVGVKGSNKKFGMIFKQVKMR